jgi:hypothetical protein
MDGQRGEIIAQVRGLSMITSIGPLSTNEVARHLGVHPNSVKRIPAYELPFFRFGKRGDRRYLIEHVERYIAKRIVK